MTVVSPMAAAAGEALNGIWVLRCERGTCERIGWISAFLLRGVTPPGANTVDQCVPIERGYSTRGAKAAHDVQARVVFVRAVDRQPDCHDLALGQLRGRMQPEVSRAI